MNRYEKFNQLDKDLNSLIVEVAGLHQLAVMDGNISEAEINGRIGEIQFILHDSVGYQLQLIRNMLNFEPSNEKDAETSEGDLKH